MSGPAGDRGPRGFRGERGPQGAKGQAGAEGPAGRPFMTVAWETPPNNVIVDGVWLVGKDIEPGLYRTMSEGCYWARLRDLTGSRSILANDNTSGPSYVEILPTDVAFESVRCEIWAKVEN